MFACDRCPVTFTARKNLDYHIEAKHEGREYMCDQCSFKTDRIPYLRKHIRVKHDGLECKKCEFIAPNQTQLSDHYKDVHEELINIHRYIHPVIYYSFMHSCYRQVLFCPRSLDTFYIASYYVNWVKTSWTYSK